MSFPFKIFRGTLLPRKPRLKAVWVRDPRTGRLVQTWRDPDDGERSCTRRLRPPTPLPLAA